jgi:methyl-accepting chemotaxis protein
MVLKPSFGVRLGIYEINDEVLATRGAVWHLLEPNLDAILCRHREKVETHFPHRGLAALIAESFEYIKRLFLNEFDELWARDAYARADREAEFGVDVRARIALWQTILRDFSRIVRRKYRFQAERGAKLVDVTTRLMVLDIANAAACHDEMRTKHAGLRGEQLGTAITAFSKTIAGLRAAVASAVDRLAATSRDLNYLSDTALSQVAAGGKAADDTTFRICKIAAAAEELAASIAEVRTQSTCGAEKASAAAQQAARANDTMWSLSAAVDKIGSVTALIAYVAEQTNLLALNATIEAARAGEAGKGFAIVANEVKLLAKQTAKATEEIGRQITLIQNQTRGSVEEIVATGTTVGSIAEIVDLLASSVGSQAIATGEIAEAASGTALNASTLVETFGRVEETIENTRAAARSVLGVSSDLAARAQQIDSAVENLLSAAQQASNRELLPHIRASALRASGA